MAHGIYGNLMGPEEVDSSKIRCSVIPIRGDYGDEMSYTNPKTMDMMATILEVRLTGLECCSAEEKNQITHCYHRGPGIQLLSPDSVVPARPLHNGFPATTIEKSLSLLSEWLQTCQQFHQYPCNNYKPKESLDTKLDRIRLIDVEERRLVEQHPTCISYAALSYVWGQDQASHTVRCVPHLI